MGVVYSAYDEKLGRAIAVKAMSSLGGDDTARKRFWRETRAAAGTNHPNVCQLYEVGEERGRLFIAMELLEGETLTERSRTMLRAASRLRSHSALAASAFRRSTWCSIPTSFATSNPGRP
jgi:serine/threonine protein kinase